MKFIDFFAGIGGIRLGLEQAGHECVGFCEWDKFARTAYKAMYDTEGEWECHDVRTASSMELPKADLWCFGFPCQDISVAGKQLGFAGHRSSLFFAVTKLIRDTKEEDRPQYLFIENVKNLLSVNRGFDFAKLLVELDEVGYDAEWSVLNSKDHGVPQNRERVFIIGHSRSRGGREVFPVEGTDGENCISVIGGVGEKNFGTQFRQGNRVHDSNGVATALGAAPVGNAGGESNLYCVPICNTNPSGNGMNGVVYDGCGLAPALTTNKGEGNKVTIPVLTPDRAEKRQNGRRFKDDGEPMFTLTGQDKHGVAVSVSEGGTIGFNTEDDGTSRSIKAQYHKNSTANFIRRDSFGATGAAKLVEVSDET